MKRWSMLGILVAALCALAFWGAPVVAGETMDKIEKTGKIKVGFREDSIPFAFIDPKVGKQVGFSVDMTAREKLPGVTAPEMVLPASAHPAFDKAAQYFGVRAVRVSVRADLRADVEACHAAISPQTILLVGSAPSYPHGVVDPIAELAALAQERGLLFHTDACVGGFFLPFARRLGYVTPDFDFSVPGVTSISADLHNYGYAAKPASVIL